MKQRSFRLLKDHKTFLKEIPTDTRVDFWTLGITIWGEVAQQSKARTLVETLATQGFIKFDLGRIRRTPTDPNGPLAMTYSLTEKGKRAVQKLR